MTAIALPIDSLYTNESTGTKRTNISVKTQAPSREFNKTPIRKNLPATENRHITPYNLLEEPFYVFNDSANGHFVIISADERMSEILGYADNGIFNYSTAPEALKRMMKQYAKEYVILQTTNKQKNKTIKTLIPPISPIISTKWGQGLPYNKKTPYIGINRSVTGCVATAMAQIMNLYEYPSTGIGKHSYISATDELNMSLDFSTTTYDWSSMLDRYLGNYTKAEADAVAVLMRSCGVAVNMDYCYGPTGAYSAAYSLDVPYALRTHFGYNDNTVYYSKDYFSDEEWNSIILEELNSGRPVYYSGNGATGGHAFILDGCDELGLYHVNWGWEGSCDGYFTLSALEPYENDYSNGQEMVCRISPETIGEEESVFYADYFLPYSKEVAKDASAYFSVAECYNFSNRTSLTRQNVTEKWNISLALYDDQFKFIKNLDSFETELSSLWGYEYAWFEFIPSKIGLVDGKTYYVAPNVGRVGGENQTRIRTLNGETDFCKIHISNGKLIIEEGNRDTNAIEVDGVRYELIEDDQHCVKVTGTTEEESYIYIPEYITHESIKYTVITIDDEAFINSTNLQSIELPSTIKRIGSNAFKGCTNLQKLICKAKNPPICESWITHPFIYICNVQLLVPEDTRGIYRTTEGWNDFISISEMNETIPILKDVTSEFVINPNFNSGFYGWTSTTGAINNQLNNNQVDGVFSTGLFWENWNATPFSGKMYQEISAPVGLYKLETAAFTSKESGAYVYANTATKEVNSAYFDKIYSVETIVIDEILEIGLMMPEANQTWVGIDNVRLYYSESVGDKFMSEILALQIKSSFEVTFRNSMENGLLEELNLAIEEAEIALRGDVEKEMMDAYIVLTDVTHRAQYSSEKYQNVRNALEVLEYEISISAAADEIIEEAETLYENIWESYIEGVWTSDEEIAHIIDKIENMIIKVKIPYFTNASDDNPIDMTSVIANNDLSEYNLDWSGSGGWLMNTDFHNVEFWNENFSYYQKLAGLPNGIYKISLQGYYRPGTSAMAADYYTEDDRSKLNALLFADTGDTITHTYVQSIMEGASDTRKTSSDKYVSGKYIPYDMWSASVYFAEGEYTENYLFVEVKNNTLTIGLYKDVWIPEDWMIFNQWNLHYYGTDSKHRHGECSGTYKLTYKGGDKDFSLELCPGDSIHLPQDYVKYGHTFKGWGDAPKVMPDENLTIEGEFTPTIYAVIYRNIDGTELFRDSVAYDNTLILRDYLIADGTSFNSWIYKEGEIPETMPAHDIELIGDISTNITDFFTEKSTVDVYTINGILLKQNVYSKDLINVLEKGLYIINRRIIFIK